MLKPPAANMTGMTDTLDFVKSLWGSMNLPGTNLSSMGTPPLSAEDLDKRIADLKAVESWLNMNLAMLRGTIQTMEVQRATLSTLKSMGASMAEAMRQSGVSAEKMAGMPFGTFFGRAVDRRIVRIVRIGKYRRRWNGPARHRRPGARPGRRTRHADCTGLVEHASGTVHAGSGNRDGAGGWRGQDRAKERCAGTAATSRA
jgi:hypothetical protein